MVTTKVGWKKKLTREILEESWEYEDPWEPTTFIFRGYNPYIGGLKPSFFMVLGSKEYLLLKRRVAFILFLSLLVWGFSVELRPPKFEFFDPKTGHFSMGFSGKHGKT